MVLRDALFQNSLFLMYLKNVLFNNIETSFALPPKNIRFLNLRWTEQNFFKFLFTFSHPTLLLEGSFLQFFKSTSLVQGKMKQFIKCIF